jgi:hypothetical protein
MNHTRFANPLLMPALAVGASCTADPQARVASMADDERHAFFLTAVRDADFVCDELLSAQRADEAGAVWRIACSGAVAYLASVEPDGRVVLSPAPYTEVPPRNATGPADEPTFRER